jgi:hypothetical protein
MMHSDNGGGGVDDTASDASSATTKTGSGSLSGERRAGCQAALIREANRTIREDRTDRMKTISR